MRKPRLTNEERLMLLRLAGKKDTLVKRKRRLYNKIFRKSFLFKAAWIIRPFYMILFVVVALLFNKATGIKKEIVKDKHVESYKRESGYGTFENTTLFLETNARSYTSNFTDFEIPDLKTNDTVRVEQNIFGKAIYLTNPGWRWKYSIDSDFKLYCVILFITVISLFFNDGLDRLTGKILWVTLMADLMTILLFFVL